MRVYKKQNKTKNYHRHYCLTAGLTTAKWILLQKALPNIKSAAGEPSVDVSKPKRRYFYCTSMCGLLNKKRARRLGHRSETDGGDGGRVVVVVVGGSNEESGDRVKVDQDADGKID